MTEETEPSIPHGLILVINSGSSSWKFAVFDSEDAGATALARGTMSDRSSPGFEAADSAGKHLVRRRLGADASSPEIFASLIEWVESLPGGRVLVSVGHRIVHGGEEFYDPVVLTGDRIESLAQLTPLAPLHQPRCLEAVRILADLRPQLLQIACFDTAFHRSIDATVRRYGLPRRFEDQGIRKYGFHGLSYEHIAYRLAKMGESPKTSTVVAHLGSGASVCAMRDGQSHDTSMGFSVLDGLPMATRCGSIDPGAILYMQRHLGLDAAEIEDLLYHDAGLLGVSGISGDLRVLVASKDAHAIAAVDFYCFHVARQVAIMANTLGGLGRLVFTGGVGEHLWEVRATICARLEWLGVRIDEEANRGNNPCVTAGGSKVTVLVIPAGEEAVIARHLRALTLKVHKPSETRWTARR